MKIKIEKLEEIKKILSKFKIVATDEYINNLFKEEESMMKRINNFPYVNDDDILTIISKKLINKPWFRNYHSDAEKTLFLIKLFDAIKMQKEQGIKTSVLTKIEFVN